MQLCKEFPPSTRRPQARRRHAAPLWALFCALIVAPIGAPANAEQLGAEGPAIAGGGVMGVRTGVSLDQAKAAAPELAWVYEPAFMVDFSADCALREPGGEELFCALVYENPERNGGDMIEAVVVLSPALKTATGAHVGMPLAEAAALYGAPTLSYHLANEGREFLSFADAPDWLSFRADRDGARAGVYPPLPSDAEFQETNRFRPDAVLDSLWIN